MGAWSVNIYDYLRVCVYLFMCMCLSICLFWFEMHVLHTKSYRKRKKILKKKNKYFFKTEKKIEANDTRIYEGELFNVDSLFVFAFIFVFVLPHCLLFFVFVYRINFIENNRLYAVVCNVSFQFSKEYL